jgi:predicted TIM-barrel fold metal-dependent hydrolase
MSITRRAAIASLAAAAVASAARPKGVLVDTHVHLFAKDRTRFPYAPMATYQPEPADLEDYRKFFTEAKIDHTVIVHPEPYQDDHTYLEYCFENEPSKGAFKGTCLFDPARGDTPARLKRLMARHPGRIVAFRIHAMQDRGVTPSDTGSITNRNLEAAYMKRTWRAVADAGIAVEMHFKPFFAPQINKLKQQFPSVPVVLDHLGRAGMGTDSDFKDVLALAKFPNGYMKYSGLDYASKTGYPFDDAKPTVRQAFDAFGPDRMIWGGIGMNMESMEQNVAVLDNMFAFASESDRAKIRGLTAMKIYKF